ncbi:hypothetical protein NMG60_11035130 [Bertholletia excelsa]
MGASSPPYLVDLGLLGSCNRNGALPELGAEARRAKKKGVMKSRNPRPRRVLMKRRARLEASRRPKNVVEKRVRVLRKLIPHSESAGLDGLFRDAADYILTLQMRVRVMQIMAKALSESDE